MMGRLLAFFVSNVTRSPVILAAVLLGTLLSLQGCGEAIVCDGDVEPYVLASPSGGSSSGGAATLGITLPEAAGGMAGAMGLGGLGGMGGADRDLPEPTCFCSLR